MEILKPVTQADRAYEPQVRKSSPPEMQQALEAALDRLDKGQPIEPLQQPSSKDLPSLLVLLDVLTDRLSHLFDVALRRVGEEAVLKTPVSLGQASPSNLRVRSVAQVRV